jgi:hypothetical protein
MSDSVTVFSFAEPHGRAVHAAGVDLGDVNRLHAAIDRSGPALVRRLFDADERAAVRGGDDEAGTAALFGIKESVVKVVGGMPAGGRYRDIQIDLSGLGGSGGLDATGQPVPTGTSIPAQTPVRLGGELARWADEHGVEVTAGGTPFVDGLVLAWALAVPADSRPTGESRC